MIEALRRRLGEVRFVGAAGPQMAAAGCEVVLDITARANMLSHAFGQVGFYLRTLRRLKKAIRDIRPDLHVPIDSPAFNWHLAKAARKAGTPVFYYVAPQIWAWAPWRLKKLRRLTDHVVCILPFEEKYFRARDVEATYVGHPLLETMPPRPLPLPDLLDAWAMGSWQVAMLPGSRRGEIHNHTPALLDVAAAIQRRWDESKCVVVANTEADAEEMRQAAGRPWPTQVELAVGRTREILAASHFAVAKSGTITLELAHYGVPMVTFYRVSPLLRLIYRVFGRLAVPTEMFCLVNILAGRRVVPEIIPWTGKMEALRERVLETMEDIGCLVETRQTLLRTVDSLRLEPSAGAADHAADLIVQFIRDRGKLRSPSRSL